MDAELLRGLAGLREAIKDWGDDMPIAALADLLVHVDRIELSVAQGQGWRPIESCPDHVVMLHIPAHEGFPWADMPMPGIRTGGGFSVYTPYTMDGKGVVCPVDAPPLGWMELPTRTLTRVPIDRSDYRTNPAKLAEWLRIHFRANYPTPEFQWIYDALHAAAPAQPDGVG